MKVLIVAKTRRGGGACVGGIAEDGRSVRLIASNAATNPTAGLEYTVGEVWEIEAVPDPNAVAPHLENILVLGARRLRVSGKVEETIRRFMPPIQGPPEILFDGLAQATAIGALYVAERTGLPRRSTLFWEPDQPLLLDVESKRIRYRYGPAGHGHTLTFVGFQEPLPEIPPFTLVRVSLAHPWRPQDHPGEELRCFLQLSGWFPSSWRQASLPASERGILPRDPPLPLCPAASLPASERGILPRDPPFWHRALDVLKQTFGFAQFFPVQAQVIHRVLERQDTLAVLPTGGGKSLCYQLPSLLFEGLTVVISPLVALMQDQVRQLHELNIPAACLNHMVPLKDWIRITHEVRAGTIKILYLAPETLLKPETLLLMGDSQLSCLAVDEAHCISEWGHDFRPDYRRIQDIRTRFSQAICLALTATATDRVRDDIRRLLRIPREGQFVASFNRPNLHLAVQARRDPLLEIVTFLQSRRDQSGIIYCGTRKQVEELCAGLNANGYPALPYHAGLDDAVRQRNQDQFIKDDASLIVATIAFGMGINKSNVRFVIHAHLPKDLESYYQEVGRAGRDGLSATCLLLYSRADAMIHRHFIQQGAPSEQAGRHARLNALMQFAENRGCRRVPLLGYFGEPFVGPCGHCDNCVRPTPSPDELTDVTFAARQFLSCVQATGGVFGAAHVIAVLRGSRSERVLARHHDQLSVFGCGQERSNEGWRDLLQHLLHQGLLEQEIEFGSLRLTAKGRQVLERNEPVSVQSSPIIQESKQNSVRESHDPLLFERLRELRKRLAIESGIPPYLVFSDRALIEMATLLPKDEADLLTINGVGQAKLAKYGAAFLQAINPYRSDRENQAWSGDSPPKPIVRPPVRHRFHDVGESFASGESVPDIARRYNVTNQTVWNHLERFVREGGRIDAQRVLNHSSLNESEREQALGLFQTLGMERLSPIHEALAGSVNYEQLHLLRVYVLSRGK